MTEWEPHGGRQLVVQCVFFATLALLAAAGTWRLHAGVAVLCGLAGLYYAVALGAGVVSSRRRRSASGDTRRS